MIPKVIHQLCFPTERDMPIIFQPHMKQVEEYVIRNLPDYKLKRWSFEEVINADELSKELFHRWEHILSLKDRVSLVFWADIFRWHVLYKYGGIYLDCDCTILRSFDDLLHYSFVANRSSYYYMIDIVLSEPNHIVTRKLIDNYLYVCKSFFKRDPIYWLLIYNITLFALREHITTLHLSTKPQEIHTSTNCYVVYYYVNSWKEDIHATI